MTNKIERYWQQYLSSLSGDDDYPETFAGSFSFGFTPDDASAIANLVIKGFKTSTGSLLWSFEADGKHVPKAGDHWIIIDGNEDPVCIIRTTDVAIIPFDEVPEIYAREGGERDKTLATWRPMYWEYIASECRRMERKPTEKIPLVMERFTVVYAEPSR